MVLAQLLAACAACEQRGGDPTRVVPADARWVTVVPSIARLRERLTRFLAGVEGASGVIDLVRERYGVDLGDLEALGLVGVDTRGGAVFFETEQAFVVAVGVSGPERFLQLVETRAVKGGGATITSAGGEPAVQVATAPAAEPDAAPAWRLAYGITGDAVGLLVFASDEQVDPQAQWRALDAGQGGFLGTPSAQQAAQRATEDAVAWGVVTGAPRLPAALGQAASLVGPYLAGLDTWTGVATLTPERLALEVDGRFSGQGSLPSGWFRSDGAPSTLPALFPKTTTVYLRAAPELARLQALPGWLRDRVLPPAIPGIDPNLLPPTSQLLDLLQGDMALAVLGLDPGATVTRIVSPNLPLWALLQSVHVAVAARLRSPQAGLAMVQEVAQTAPTRGFAVAPLAGGGWTGATFTSRAGTYGLLVRGDVLVLVTGAGEAERFIAVGEEQAVSLATLGGEPAVDAALGLSPATAGAVVSFTRVTRELADKGVPPYFLKIINDIRVVAAVLRLRGEGLTVTLDVAL